jgi:osmotically inducible protein OsmC
MIKRTAAAAWAGSLKDGVGTISSESGVLSNARYGFKARFENGTGTNPEELIAAAHAGCFSMALSAQLGDMHLVPDSIRTTATVVMDKVGDSYSITGVHLDLAARIPGIDQRSFDAVVNRAKLSCPVSKLINARITLESHLEGG